jgi:PiT family inorganic phosphate transporter
VTVALAAHGSPVAVGLLIAFAVAFAWNLGVHYTGAVMGMPHAARAVTVVPALVLVGLLAFLGATFASGRVEETVGHHLVADGSLDVPAAVVIVAVAGGLTAFYNWRRVPTSTIQILVFTVIGVGVAAGAGVRWGTLWRLAFVWAAAPCAAYGLGFAFTRLLDLVVPRRAAHEQAEAAAAKEEATGQAWTLASAFPAVAEPLPAAVAKQLAGDRLRLRVLRLLPALLLLVGIAASFVMGANDVANATGPLVLTGRLTIRDAGLVGGAAMAVGAVTWGRRILRTVAFDIVHMDLAMASAAQGVQALVVILAVSQGYFTSMNQALVGAMAGTGRARGSETVQRRQLYGILRGWAIGPVSGFALGYVGEWIVRGLS